jgi:3-dehydroquinate synthetase
LIGYIKNRKVIVLVDNGSAHNFIHRKVAKETHCYVHAVHNFQIMIANGGMMKCGGKCEKVKLQLGEYQLKSNMFVIEMGGCDVVLGENG